MNNRATTFLILFTLLACSECKKIAKVNKVSLSGTRQAASIKSSLDGCSLESKNNVKVEYKVKNKAIGVFNDGLKFDIACPRAEYEGVKVTGNFSKAVQSFHKTLGQNSKVFMTEATGQGSLVALNQATGKKVKFVVTGEYANTYCNAVNAKDVEVVITGEKAKGTLILKKVKGKVSVKFSGDSSKLIVKDCDTTITGVSTGKNDVIEHERGCKCNVINKKTGRNICRQIESDKFQAATLAMLDAETLGMMGAVEI